MKLEARSPKNDKIEMTVLAVALVSLAFLVSLGVSVAMGSMDEVALSSATNTTQTAQ